jgi:Ca-activated chloride channel family protein
MAPSLPMRPVRRATWALLPACLAAAAYATPSTQPAATPPLQAALDLSFAPDGGTRTLVSGVVSVPATEATVNQHGFYNLALSGEVRVGGRTYDRFGYRFDVPGAESSGPPLTLLFERPLRPGSFELHLSVEDLQSGRSHQLVQTLAVPRLAPERKTWGASTIRFAALTATSASPAPRRPAVRLVPPPDVVVGKQRFAATVADGAVARVTFSLDGKPVVTRSRPPFTVELDLGDHPALRRLRVEAFDAAGQPVGSDEVELNGGEAPFLVRLAMPPREAQQRGRFDARVEVAAPGGKPIDRVELFLDDRPVGMMERAPWTFPVVLPGPDPTLLRAVAYLRDGSSADTSVLLNAPNADVVDVDLVELYAAVVDRRGRPVKGLAGEAFRVFEEGAPQRVERFAEVNDLPLHAALVVDTSNSMTMRLAEVKQAAGDFLRQIVTPRDKVTLISFDNAPRVRVDFTSDLAFLANGLEGLRPGGGTALYDSLVFTLEQLAGIAGQRVVVLLSDGVDERSRATADEVLELARRSAVTIYAIGLEDPRPDAPVLDRPLLERLAEQSGGRAFFVRGDGGLQSAYAAIEREVRSRYLLAYYSSHAGSGDGFRVVDVKVEQANLAARTIRGYYP